MRVASRFISRIGLCFLGLLWCALPTARTLAQSNTRPSSAIANRSTPAVVAEPKPQGANPFLPNTNRDVRLPLALNGFCSVSLRERQEWLLGSERNQLNFDGQIYWFVNQRQRAIFAANPQRYLPALGGDCVVTFAETSNRTRANPQYGILHNQRLFFFRSQVEQEKFRADPSRYDNVDLANKGQCLVSKIDQQKQLPGLPATTAIVGGMRYLFAGVDQQQKFLINMRHYGVKRATMNAPKGSDRRISYGPPALLAPGALQNIESDQSPESLQKVGGTNRAMAGYCPVSIRNAGIWSLGAPSFRAEFDGQTYLFAGEAQQQRFSQNPLDYVPALGGYCVVSERDNNQRIRGNIYHAAQYEGRLFLFAGAEQKIAFKASPATYANVDLVEGGHCVVTLVDEGRSVAGLNELLIWHQGKRYLFASPEMQAKFRKDTQRYQDR